MVGRDVVWFSCYMIVEVMKVLKMIDVHKAIKVYGIRVYV